MSIVYIALAAVAVPILFIMLIWVGVTAYRLLHPEEPQPLSRDAVLVRRAAAQRGAPVPVGARQIREDQRHATLYQLQHDPYSFYLGDSSGFPECWVDDLWCRRN